MRFLIFFILSSFLFIAPSQGKAGSLVQKQAIKAQKYADAPHIADHTITDELNACIIHTNQIKGLSAQFRFHPSANFVNTAAFVEQSAYKPGEKYSIEHYLYCKPIRLILVFPQHYYW